MPISATDRDVLLSDGRPANLSDSLPAHPSGVTSVQVAQWFDFLLGNAITQIWHAGQDTNSVVDDLKIARTYLDLKIKQLESAEGKPHV
jgi:hypothetical protein